MMSRFRKAFQWGLEAWVISLMIALTIVVVGAVVFRKMGQSLGWTDEVARVLLAWLTYYGSALAALKRAHIGFPGVMERFSPKARIPLVVLGEAFVIGFFLLMAWVGLEVCGILEGDSLVSLPWVPLRLTQSVIPIGGVLFIVAELLSLPEALRCPRLSELGSHPGSASQEAQEVSP